MINYQTIFRIVLWVSIVFSSACFRGATKNNHEKDSVSFGICTDVHKDVMHDADRRMRIFVNDMNKKEADFIIQLGDFCYPQTMSDSFLNIFKGFRGPHYSVLGNHDRDNGVTWVETTTYFEMPAPYYSFDKNGFHFIVLNGNELADSSQSHYPRYISNSQMQWLKTDMEETDKHCIIFVHQSLFDSHGVINRDSVRNLLAAQILSDGKQKVIACFNGHSHINAAEKISGIWYVAINSMSYHWVGEKHLHVSYSQEVHDKFPWIEYTCPYKEPLYAFVTISEDGTISIEGQKSGWQGFSPQDLGYSSDYYLPEWISPLISSRILK